MGMQGGNAGLVGAQRYEFTAFEGQARIAGQDDRGFPFTYTPGENTLLLARNGTLLSPDEYTAADGFQVLFTAGTLRAGDRIFAWSLPPFNIADTYSRAAVDLMTFRRRNRITDPGIRVCVEVPSGVAYNLTNGALVYISDSIIAQRFGATGNATVQRLASVTPGGSGFRIRWTCATANPAPAAGDFAVLQTPTEGVDIADLRFGTSGAKTILKRVGLRSSVAGDVALTLRNGVYNRTWLGKLNIAPGEVNTDVVKWVVFTGDTTGTWPTDNSLGWVMGIALCAGASYQGVTGWQAGGLLAPGGCINFMATAGMTLDLFDVGSYDVSDITNPVPPRFELRPQYEDELQCLRYFRQVGNEFIGYVVSGNTVEGAVTFANPAMRDNPAIGLIPGRNAFMRYTQADLILTPTGINGATSRTTGCWLQFACSNSGMGVGTFITGKYQGAPFLNANARMI